MRYEPAPFAYVAPDTIDAVLDALTEHGWDAKLLAGGQSLIPSMNFRLIQPAVIVDLNRVSGLDGLSATAEGGVRLGAMVRQRRVERDPAVARLSPLLAEALPYIAHPQIRNRGTIGGSLAHADPAAELPVVAVALNARFHVRRRGNGRWVDAADFFQGTFAVDCEPEELLTEIIIPPWPDRTGWAFVEVARRHGDYALVGLAATVTMDGNGRCRAARLVYLNVGDGPVDAGQAAGLLRGQVIDDDAIAAAADAADGEIDPLGNVHASAAYQRHLARVLTRRALKTAVARAGAANRSEP